MLPPVAATCRQASGGSGVWWVPKAASERSLKPCRCGVAQAQPLWMARRSSLVAEGMWGALEPKAKGGGAGSAARQQRGGAKRSRAFNQRRPF